MLLLVTPLLSAPVGRAIGSVGVGALELGAAGGMARLWLLVSTVFELEALWLLLSVASSSLSSGAGITGSLGGGAAVAGGDGAACARGAAPPSPTTMPMSRNVRVKSKRRLARIIRVLLQQAVALR